MELEIESENPQVESGIGMPIQEPGASGSVESLSKTLGNLRLVDKTERVDDESESSIGSNKPRIHLLKPEAA